MYISAEQLAKSLKQLDAIHPFYGISFLACKELELPVEEPIRVDIAGQETSLLETYYNPLPNSQYYYVPLRSGKNRWVLKNKYPDSTLKKARTSTFRKVFQHPTANEWAWASNYLLLLSLLQVGKKVPVFHLAVWMFRNQNWSNDTKPDDIIRDFFLRFNISEAEQEALFDTTLEMDSISAPLLQEEPVTWKRLGELIGSPPDAPPDEGGGLENLTLIGVGPAKHIVLDLAPRLNIITGDNGLGKTFVLDCAWWALSGTWADPETPVYPRLDSARPAIEFRISGSFAESEKVTFNKTTQSWPLSNDKRPVLPGIVVYARVDGSCVIWDPVRHYWSVEGDRVRGLESDDAVRLSQNEIWDGKDIIKIGKKQPVCNGLIRDWITWQYIHTTDAFDSFSRVLEKLSPQNEEFVLQPGNPTKLPNDARVIPTIKMPYGDTPVVLLSAGIKRILSLAYLLVWTWEEHKAASKLIDKAPQSKLVFLIDEMEAHLHPQWQRVIVPALLDVIKILEQQLEVQLIIATHSPLVLASVEPLFQDKLDGLFTLDLVDQELVAKEVQYIKYGSINSWLTSEIFDLRRPYSVDAEQALVDAKQLQMAEHPDPQKIKEVSARLAQYLPAIDPIWPRWTFFAERNGVDL
jgi:AAA domain, putative AbiEii toxin, Type IV TA system